MKNQDPLKPLDNARLPVNWHKSVR
ncbi:MAG: hypothetical protein IPP22_08410 [Nitrosomonas sp.]|nr:hypothetical protein [Nitrosomonas sp.]